MAVKFGIRNYSRNGNQVTFTLVALNADGSIDTTYTGAFTWGPNNMSDPGTAAFSAGDLGQRTYTTTILDPNVRAGLAANFPGSATGANISVSGPNGTNVSFGNQGDHLLVGGAGNDTINGNNGDDLFLLQQGGNESVNGGAGNDGFYFGATYTADDIVNGGAGNRDQVGLQGNYAGGVSLGSLLGVETVVLLPGSDARFGDTANNLYDYNIVADAGTIVSNNRLTIQTNTLRVGEDFTFNGSASGIDFLVYGGQGTDNLTGGSGDDGFFFGQGRFGATDIVNGGGGSDQLGLQGNYSGGGVNPGGSLVFGANQLVGIEMIVLLSASDDRFGAGGGTARYSLTMNDGNVQAGQQLTIQANTLRTGEFLYVDGRQETDGTFRIFSGADGDILHGGQRNDEIWGGAGNDSISGHGGADIMRGGTGTNNFYYRFLTDSLPNARDQILDFKLGDTIQAHEVANNHLPAFTGFRFIGGNAQTGAGQIQVIQSGTAATVNFFIDSDNNPDMVIDVTVLDGHTLTASDFTGLQFNEPIKQGGAAAAYPSPGLGGKLWNNDGSGAFLYLLGGPELIDGPDALHALPGSTDLLL